MVVLINVEEPYDKGVLTVTLSAANEKGGISVQTANTDLSGSKVCSGTFGGDEDDDTPAIKKIMDYIEAITGEEKEDVCKEM